MAEDTEDVRRRRLQCPGCAHTDVHIPKSWTQMPCVCPTCGINWRVVGRTDDWNPISIPDPDQTGADDAKDP